jgi:hypothetical protein
VSHGKRTPQCFPTIPRAAGRSGLGPLPLRQALNQMQAKAGMSVNFNMIHMLARDHSGAASAE